MTTVSHYQHTQPWTRSQDGIIAGVCTGIAERFDVTPWTIRLIWILFILLFGTGILAYFLCVLCFPREDRLAESRKGKVLGVCLRLSQSLGVDVGFVRLLACILALGSLGSAVLVYIVLHFVVPEPNPTNGIIDIR